MKVFSFHPFIQPASEQTRNGAEQRTELGAEKKISSKKRKGSKNSVSSSKTMGGDTRRTTGRDGRFGRDGATKVKLIGATKIEGEPREEGKGKKTRG